jgi:choline dehydrogenase-like flavoprotein
MIMSSLDLSKSNLENVDVCIIGAGAAGITLACEFDGFGLKVILLEAGGLKPDASSMDFYRGTATEPHPDLAQYRRTAFGGTTSIWGGRCVPLDPIDFERREYVSQSGWPISYSEVEQYYPQALTYCDAGKFDFTVAGALKQASPTIGGFHGAGVVLADRIERYSLPTDFGKRYRSRIAQSADVTAVLYARCVKLCKRAGEDSIESLEFVDRAGVLRRIVSRVVVLATGGIEVPRLLMTSDPEGHGLGNRNDLLGRFYSCHFENTCGRLVSNGAPVAFDFEKTMDGVYCRRQLRFSENSQRLHKLLNMAFRLHFPEYSDFRHGSSVMSAIYLAKSTLPTEYRAILHHNRQSNTLVPTLPHVRNVLTGLPQLFKFAGDWLFRIRFARRKLPYTLVANADGSFPLEFNSEQTPTASNRVSLTQEGDRHGLKRVHVTWRVCRSDVESACRGFLLLRDSINSSSVCRLEFDEDQLRDQISNSPPLGGHHIGTARMALTERDGVVGPDCAVFGLPNLFIASSAVFPTSGYANPTLTIVALAIRLAKHIRRDLAAAK